MDFADAVHRGLRLQLEWTLRQKDEITSFSLQNNPSVVPKTSGSSGMRSISF